MQHRRRIVGFALALGLVAAACTGADEASARIPGCERSIPDGWSVARVWDEATLEAIRRDFPAPTVPSRNLFHMSAGMWDAWAAYDRDAAGYLRGCGYVFARHAGSA